MKVIKELIGVVADVWTLFGVVIVFVGASVLAAVQSNPWILAIVGASAIALALVIGGFRLFIEHHDKLPQTLAQYDLIEREITYQIMGDGLDIEFSTRLKIRSRVPELAFLQQKLKWSSHLTRQMMSRSSAYLDQGKAGVVWSPFPSMSGLAYYAIVFNSPLKHDEVRVVETKHVLRDESQSALPELSLNVTKKLDRISLKVVFASGQIPASVSGHSFKGTVFSGGSVEDEPFRIDSINNSVELEKIKPRRNRTFRLTW
ncbi:hypothetical protein [Arthrobacter woluwensis]|uniref:hypothetical protein n=1 Tax=Arthrobacter woluwensis TaxID=156980 RepID=UPI0011A4268B|nr:hypothetical protein [Arthrobacter woluwensis]